MGKTRSRPKRDPLAEPMQAFVSGDYVRARAGFEEAAQNPVLSEVERATAQDLAEATRVDRLTLAVGAACTLLFLVATIVTAALQP